MKYSAQPTSVWMARRRTKYLQWTQHNPREKSNSIRLSVIRTFVNSLSHARRDTATVTAKIRKYFKKFGFQRKCLLFSFSVPPQVGGIKFGWVQNTIKSNAQPYISIRPKFFSISLQLRCEPRFTFFFFFSITHLEQNMTFVSTLKSTHWLFLVVGQPPQCWGFYITHRHWAGTQTRYRLDGPGMERRWGRISRIRPDRLWGPPSLLHNDYRVSFPGVKRPGRGVNHPPLSRAEVKQRVELYLWAFMDCSRANFIFTTHTRTHTHTHAVRFLATGRQLVAQALSTSHTTNTRQPTMPSTGWEPPIPAIKWLHI
jgi:hypothetical protein